jgi:chromosome segregation ATPase
VLELRMGRAGLNGRGCSEISKAFENVTAESMSSTRKLDDLYYSILEKLAMLRGPVDELQDLEVKMKQMVKSFDSDAERVKTEIEGKINVFAGFEKQNQRIESFEYGIKQSKEQTENLTKRLENARARVRGLENQEAEIQSNITRKLAKTLMSNRRLRLGSSPVSGHLDYLGRFDHRSIRRIPRQKHLQSG